MTGPVLPPPLVSVAYLLASRNMLGGENSSHTSGTENSKVLLFWVVHWNPQPETIMKPKQELHWSLQAVQGHADSEPTTRPPPSSGLCSGSLGALQSDSWPNFRPCMEFTIL